MYSVREGGKSIRRNGEPAGTRTQDPRLKRALLYQLSYGLAGGAIERESIPASGKPLIQN
jgi:hypothetical protein